MLPERFYLHFRTKSIYRMVAIAEDIHSSEELVVYHDMNSDICPVGRRTLHHPSCKNKLNLFDIALHTERNQWMAIVSPERVQALFAFPLEECLSLDIDPELTLSRKVFCRPCLIFFGKVDTEDGRRLRFQSVAIPSSQIH